MHMAVWFFIDTNDVIVASSSCSQPTLTHAKEYIDHAYEHAIGFVKKCRFVGVVIAPSGVTVLTVIRGPSEE